jgi:thiol-disulfide isomerase/thioredoxin
MSVKHVAIAVLLGVAGSAHADDCARKVGERLPDIKATDSNDKAMTIRPSGGWIFVTVGAKWCDPCAKELPTWDKLAPDFSKIVWYAVDIDEKVADGKAFHDKLNIRNMRRAYTAPSNISNLGSVMPSSYVVDSKGVIRYERCGFEKEGVDDEVKAMRAALVKLGL